MGMTGAVFPSLLRGGWPATGWPGGVAEDALDVAVDVERCAGDPTRLASLGTLPSRGRETAQPIPGRPNPAFGTSTAPAATASCPANPARRRTRAGMFSGPPPRT